MDLFINFSRLFVLFGAGLSFLLCGMDYIKKDSKINSKFMFFLYMGITMIALSLLLDRKLDDIFSNYPASFLITMFAFFSLAPQIVRFAFSITYSISKSKLSFYSFIPPFFLIIPGILFYTLDKTTRDLMIFKAFETYTYSELTLVIYLGLLSSVIFYGYLFYYAFKFNKDYKLLFPKIIYLIVTTSILGLVIIAIGYFLKNLFIMAIGCDFVSVAIIMVYLFQSRYPRIFTNIKEYIEDEKYKKSILNSLNLDKVKKHLKLLIDIRKLYLEPKLKLHHLADELHISPKQLSSLLNSKYNKGFNDFLNYYRIQEAKEQLVNERYKQILEIAFDTGFSSKATFNAQFKKLVSMTPQEYRRNNSINEKK